MTKVGMSFALLLFLAPAAAAAEVECWIATFEDTGLQASHPTWVFETTSMLSVQLELCFGEGTGTVLLSPGESYSLQRFGDLTLTSFGSTTLTDVVDVYQIERSTGRFSYVQSRVSTNNLGFGGATKAFLGTARPK